MTNAEKDFLNNIKSFLQNDNVDIIDKTEYSTKLKTLFKLPFKIINFKYRSDINETIYNHPVSDEDMYYEPNLGLLIVKQIFTKRGFDE